MKLRPRRRGAEANDAQMTLGDHLRELRWRLLVCVGTVLLLLVPAWFLYPWFSESLQAPYCEALRNISATANCKFLNTAPLAPFTLRLRIAGWGAVVLAMPVILWQLWRFIAPGLFKRERRYALAFVLSALSLFGLGAWLAYVILPKAVDFLVRVGGPEVETRYSIADFTRIVVLMMVAFGVGFEFPILLVALQMIGVIQPGTLARYRRQGILVIVIIAAAITPSGDPFSLFALALPMYAFYELSIFLGWLFVRRRRRRGEVGDDTAGATDDAVGAEGS
ncbi:MAG: twin-arginine translocase subunit TatC [Actinomycetes bacterium]